MSKAFDFKPLFSNWLFPIIILLIINYLYFLPVLSGKVIEQDDIMLGYAKSKEIRDYRESHDDEPLWTNAMFSGMPTFQLSTAYPNNWLGGIQNLFATIFGQNSWVYIFPLMLISFFLTARSYKVNPYISALGAFAFAFSSFFIISFAAGHVAKVRTAAYIPALIMGVMLTYKGKERSGFCITALAIGLSVVSNHFQITFYNGLILLCMAVIFLIQFAKESKLPLFVRRSVILIAAAILGIAPNVGNLWSTLSYTQETIRGGNSRLEEEAGKETGKKGLDYDYAMMWSYGKTETLNLFIPFISGGGAKESYDGTATYDRLTSIFSQQGMSRQKAAETANQYTGSILYWGDQSLVNGAYYVGAVMVFLFVLGLFIIDPVTRNWILAASILSVLMAWGKNLEFFNRFLFENMPLYNKFRIPSMSLVIMFFTIPLASVLGLQKVIDNSVPKDTLKKKLLYSLYITGGLALFIALLGPSLFSLESPRDSQFVNQGFSLDMLLDDRESLMRSSAFSSLLFVVLSFGAIWLFVIDKLKLNMLLVVLFVLAGFDLITYDRDQLGSEDFVTEKKAEAQF
ncbi:MAG: hypothetical protein ACPF9D_01855, partial [Owenweeksia sp.]